MAKLKAKRGCSDLVSTLNWFKDCLKSCGKKFEVSYPFNISEIPSTQVNKSYFVVIRDYVSDGSQGCFQSVSAEVEVICWFCDGRDEQNAYEVALSDSETIRASIFSKKPDEGEKFYCFDGVIFNGASFEPYSESNDNIVVLRLSYTAKLTIDLES